MQFCHFHFTCILWHSRFSSCRSDDYGKFQVIIKSNESYLKITLFYCVFILEKIKFLFSHVMPLRSLKNIQTQQIQTQNLWIALNWLWTILKMVFHSYFALVVFHWFQFWCNVMMTRQRTSTSVWKKGAILLPYISLHFEKQTWTHFQ